MLLMRTNVSSLTLVGILLGMAVAQLPVRAASNLLENSPFLPTNLASGGAQDTAPLELRSILKEGAGYEFSLYDPSKKLSTWARLNETGHDFLVKSFDPAKEIVTVEQKSRTFRIALKEAKIIPMASVSSQLPAIAGTSPPGGAPASVPGMGQSVSPERGPFPFGNRTPGGPTPSLTPEQLRNLEADINRRRELRRQASAAQAVSPSAGQSTDQTQQH
jgi:hypothetical protein